MADNDNDLSIKVKLILDDVKRGLASLGRNLMNVKAGFDMLKGAVAALGKAIKDGMQFEYMAAGFAKLTGSMENARAHMEMLRELGRTPPFSTEQFADASKTLMTFSQGLLGSKDSLTLLADAAAATGTPLGTLATAYGKVFAMLKDGQPIDKAIKQLRNLGVVTPAAAEALVELQASGASAKEVFETLNESLQKYSGGQDAFVNTTAGSLAMLESRIEDLKTSLVEGLGEGLKAVGKEGAESLSGLTTVAQAIGRHIANVVKFVSDALNGIRLLGHVVGTVMGSLANGASFKTAFDAGKKAYDTFEVVEAPPPGFEEKGKSDLEAASAAIANTTVASTAKSGKDTIAKAFEDIGKDISRTAKEEESVRNELVKEARKSLEAQQKLTKEAAKAVADARTSLTTARAQALTSTGRIGGYQSNAEVGLLHSMGGVDPELAELKSQTRVLKAIEENTKNITSTFAD